MARRGRPESGRHRAEPGRNRSTLGRFGCPPTGFRRSSPHGKDKRNKHLFGPHGVYKTQTRITQCPELSRHFPTCRQHATQPFPDEPCMTGTMTVPNRRAGGPMDARPAGPGSQHQNAATRGAHESKAPRQHAHFATTERMHPHRCTKKGVAPRRTPRSSHTRRRLAGQRRKRADGYPLPDPPQRHTLSRILTPAAGALAGQASHTPLRAAPRPCTGAADPICALILSCRSPSVTHAANIVNCTSCAHAQRSACKRTP